MANGFNTPNVRNALAKVEMKYRLQSPVCSQSRIQELSGMLFPLAAEIQLFNLCLRHFNATIQQLCSLFCHDSNNGNANEFDRI